jgi:hypothetical protein
MSVLELIHFDYKLHLRLAVGKASLATPQEHPIQKHQKKDHRDNPGDNAPGWVFESVSKTRKESNHHIILAYE